MANFLGTKDENVALTNDFLDRLSLTLDTITKFDDPPVNFDQPEGNFDLGGTDSTSNPNHFNSNVQSSGIYDFNNTFDATDVFDVTLGAIVSMTSEDEYDLHDSGRGATLYDDAKAPYDGSPEINCGAEILVGFDNTSFANITNFQKIAQQSTIKGRFFKFRCKLTSDDNKVKPKVHDLTFTINFEKRTETGEDLVTSASGTNITFTNGFFRTPSVVIMGQGMNVGDFFTLSNKTKNGFTIQFFNSSNVGISKTFDFQATGIGLKS
tara:strand:- start:303 stop:1100 length:798 start_codon:yes stop_codon:yes gene_type:complete